MRQFKMTQEPVNWDDRPCLGTDTQLWFGPADDMPVHLQETPAERQFRERTAKAVCAECPFVQRCLADELRHGIGEQWGVRGGLTAKERQDLIRRAAAGTEVA